MASRFLTPAHVVPVGVAAVALYTSFLCAMFTPFLQKHFLFLNKIQFPFFADFNQPQRYGMARVWHILPEDFYQKERRDDRPIDDLAFDQALRDYPTVIYLHGNAANRAAPFRIRSYAHFTSRLQANVLAIDYRGFGDSHGDLSESGLVLDARAAYDFTLARSRRSNGVIFGQSLGTDVAAVLTRELHEEGRPPRGVVLMAPYASIGAVVKDFRVGGLVPLLAPLKMIPGAEYLLNRFQVTKFETDRHLPSLLHPNPNGSSKRPHIVILHANDDRIIPSSHGQVLWDVLLHFQARTNIEHEHPGLRRGTIFHPWFLLRSDKDGKRAGEDKGHLYSHFEWWT